MKVPDSEDLANHVVPESCVAVREERCEALTGVRIGQPLSHDRNVHPGRRRSYAGGRQHGGARYSERVTGPAWSETLACTYAP